MFYRLVNYRSIRSRTMRPTRYDCDNCYSEVLPVPSKDIQALTFFAFQHRESLPKLHAVCICTFGFYRLKIFVGRIHVNFFWRSYKFATTSNFRNSPNTTNYHRLLSPACSAITIHQKWLTRQIILRYRGNPS